MTSERRLFLAQGIEAVVLQVDAKHVTVSSPAPFPPGTPVPVVSPNGVVFQIKVRRCVRFAEDENAPHFRIQGRLVNLSRQQFQSVFDSP